MTATLQPWGAEDQEQNKGREKPKKAMQEQENELCPFFRPWRTYWTVELRFSYQKWESTLQINEAHFAEPHFNGGEAPLNPGDKTSWGGLEIPTGVLRVQDHLHDTNTSFAFYSLCLTKAYIEFTWPLVSQQTKCRADMRIGLLFIQPGT